METKKFEPAFQMIANTIAKINVTNTINNISNTQDLHRSFSINVKDLYIEEHEEYKSAGLDVEIITLIEEKNTESPKKFEMQLIITGIFKDLAETPNEEFEEKLKLNGVAALYSIARGCVTNISSQTLAEGKVVLPLVNFIEAKRDLETE